MSLGGRCDRGCKWVKKILKRDSERVSPISQCCSAQFHDNAFPCPVSQSRGQPVSPITLKSLLKLSALERFEPQLDYRFCDRSNAYRLPPHFHPYPQHFGNRPSLGDAAAWGEGGIAIKDFAEIADPMIAQVMGHRF